MGQPDLLGDPEASGERPPDEVTTSYFAIVPEWILDESGDVVKLYAILDRKANTDRKLWPGQAELAEKMGCSDRQVRRLVTRLREIGALVVVKRRYNGTTVYLLRKEPPTGQGSPVAPDGDDQPDTGVRTDRTEVSGLTGPGCPPKQSHSSRAKEPKILRPPDDERTDQQLITDAFTAFWKAYPRKTAKGEARKAWPRAIKAAGGDLGKIVGGVRRYAADPNLPEPQFIPHPASWLNGERWDDEPLPPRAANGHRPASSAQSVFQVVGSDGFLIE